jgi:hypothetical protein
MTVILDELHLRGVGFAIASVDDLSDAECYALVGDCRRSDEWAGAIDVNADANEALLESGDTAVSGCEPTMVGIDAAEAGIALPTKAREATAMGTSR